MGRSPASEYSQQVPNIRAPTERRERSGQSGGEPDIWGEPRRSDSGGVRARVWAAAQAVQAAAWWGGRRFFCHKPEIKRSGREAIISGGRKDRWGRSPVAESASAATLFREAKPVIVAQAASHEVTEDARIEVLARGWPRLRGDPRKGRQGASATQPRRSRRRRPSPARRP